MDKTYAETKGKSAFDWSKAIQMQIDQHPQRHTKNELYDLSGNFVTCACGNACAIIPRAVDYGERLPGEPMDNILAALGYRFHTEISEESWEDAQVTLESIESRSAELIQLELTKLNGQS